MTHSRDHLAAAHDELEQAKAAATKTLAAVQRGQAMQERCETDLANLANVDAEIAAHNAASIRDAIASGAVAELATLPAELLAKKGERDVVAERVVGVKAAIVELQAEHQKAVAAVDHAHYGVEIAVAAILKDEADAHAKAFLAAVKTLQEEHLRLSALALRQIRLAPGELPPAEAYGARTTPIEHTRSVYLAMRTMLALPDEIQFDRPFARLQECAQLDLDAFVSRLRGGDTEAKFGESPATAKVA
jgi:hypothetical protein